MGDTRVGTDIAGFRVEGVIGRGGMGVVYEARQAFPERRVALKVLSPELAEDPAFRERFMREASAAASTEHPNIVPVYAAGEAEGTLFLAMRLVEGTDLRRRVSEGPIEPSTAARIITQVADALDAAHERGLVHRDVKPGNVLLDRAGRAYLVDFGLVRRTTGTTLTQSGQFMGSIDYSAPEQIRGEEPGPAADIYSLGCVLYQSLTGSPPFGRSTEVATLYAHLEDPPPRPSGSNPRVPEALDAVVARAMAKRPEERFPTAGAMGQACLDAVGGVEAPPAGRPMPIALAVGLAAAAIAAVLTVVLLTRQGAGPPAPSAEGSSASGPPIGSVVEMDPATGELAKAIDVGPDVFGSSVYSRADVDIAVGEGGVWVSGTGSEAIHVDPVSRTVGSPIPGTRYALETAVGFRTVWVARLAGSSVENGVVLAVDPATDEILGRTEDPGGPGMRGVAVDRNAVWATTSLGALLRIEPGTGAINAAVPVDTMAGDVATGEGSVWVTLPLGDEVVRVDAGTNRVVARIPYPGEPKDIVVGSGLVWVLDRSAGTVTPIDPDTDTTGVPIGVGQDPVDLAAGLGAVWVAGQRGVVLRIDPATKDVTPFEVGAPVAAVDADRANRTLWLLIGELLP